MVERYQEPAFEVKGVHRAPKVEVIPMVIDPLGTVLRLQRFGMGSYVCQNFLEVYSCPPSLGLVTSCGRCCAPKQRELAETSLKRLTKTPENWRELHQ